MYRCDRTPPTEAAGPYHRRVPTRRALITGIGGQDGALLAALLLEQGYDVAGIVRRDLAEAYADNLARLWAPIELVEADLLDHASLARRSAYRVPPRSTTSPLPRSSRAPGTSRSEPPSSPPSERPRCSRQSGEIDPTIRFYQASSSEIFGEPRETPQTEETALGPLTPYGVAKAYAHFIAGSYRHRYGMFTCCGILYNHESPLRPRRVPAAEGRSSRGCNLARARAGARPRRPLGRRDWGYAGDYVRAMWLMLQQDEPGDYIVATGVSHSVEELVACAFDVVGLDWREHVRTRPDALLRGEGGATRPRRRRLEGT